MTHPPEPPPDYPSDPPDYPLPAPEYPGPPEQSTATPDYPSPPEQAAAPKYPSPPEKAATPPEYPSLPKQHDAAPEYPSPPEQAAAAPKYPSLPEQHNAAPEYPSLPEQAAAPEYPSPPPEYPTAPPEYPQAPPPDPRPRPPAESVAGAGRPESPRVPNPPRPDNNQPPRPSSPPEPEAAPKAEPDAEPEQPAPHPHELRFQQRRIHLTQHQRGADAATIGRLLLHIPGFLSSLVLVVLVSMLFGGLWFLVVLAWLASGALVFHRPSERSLARQFFRLRYPTPVERARLEPIWREVTARAGVESRNYELWIQDSGSVNAVAAAGHLVGVTSHAAAELPSGQLAAVLAHELGHHVGGHAWSSLLGYWYGLPGRLVWKLIGRMMRATLRLAREFACLGAMWLFVLVVVFFAVGATTISSLYGLPFLLPAVPYLLAALSRRAELRADQQAAALGFAPMLAEVLTAAHAEEQRAAEAAGTAGLQQRPLSRLLDSHPDYYTRLHFLQPYLDGSR